MIRVAFVGALAGSFAEPVRSHLTVPCEIVRTDEAQVVSLLPEVDVLITLAFTAAMGKAAKQLKLVHVPGAGLDRIDRSALPPGTALANVYGHETGIAEYVMGAMLTLARGFGRLDTALRQGVWESQWAVGTPAPPAWPELAGKTLGILGYGHIGQALARRAHAFDMEVRGIRRDPTQSKGDAFATVSGLETMDDLLRRSDYVAVTVPLSPETRGLIGTREFALMKRTAALINVARGDIVAEDALYAALVEKRIAAAAIDVWYRYPAGPGPTPPGKHPFHELPNVLMTPHVSGWTDGMLDARAKLMATNIERVAKGEPLLNQISAPA